MKYIYFRFIRIYLRVWLGCGSTRMHAHSLAVQWWLVIPKASLIGTEEKSNVCSLWDGADNEGWMVGDWTPIAGSSRAHLLIEYTHFDLRSVW